MRWAATGHVLDIFTDELPTGEARTVATSYLIFARTVERLHAGALCEELPELYAWCSDESAARELVGMRSIGSSSASKPISIRKGSPAFLTTGRTSA